MALVEPNHPEVPVVQEPVGRLGPPCPFLLIRPQVLRAIRGPVPQGKAEPRLSSDVSALVRESELLLLQICFWFTPNCPCSEWQEELAEAAGLRSRFPDGQKFVRFERGALGSPCLPAS